MAAEKQTSAPQLSVLEAILEWSAGRPLWQRDALRRIVSNGAVTPGDITELVELCKNGHGLATEIVPRPLEKTHLPANPGEGPAISLVAISDVEGVNNLANGQTLAFEPKGLTIIYGDNGAGKSGYARILKRACRARHAGKIEPNIYAPSAATNSPSATITYNLDGVEQTPIRWLNSGSANGVLSAVSVFDSDCAPIHINEKNEVAFRPFGLDIPDALATTCLTVKEFLAAEQRQLEQVRNSVFFKPLWKESTSVGKAISSLRHDTNIENIEHLGTLTDGEVAKLDRLKEDLSKDPTKAAGEQTLKAENLKRLLDVLDLVGTKTNDAALLAIRELAATAKIKRDAARLAAEKAFSGDPLKGVGDEVWRTLWESARRYSERVAHPGKLFPPNETEMRCPLCQQPLANDAIARMARFEEPSVPT